MTVSETFQSADTVLPAPHPDPVPLIPEGCETDWRECLDAGHDKGPTSTHRHEGWRAVKTATP